jgi:D-alanyl-D-alanine dipeptidase
VLLENAKEDGSWITPRDKEWTLPEKVTRFNMTETLEQLKQKSGHDAGLTTDITLYTTRIRIKK